MDARGCDAVSPSLSTSEVPVASGAVHDTPGLMDNSSAGDGHAGQQLKGLLDLPAKPLDAILSQLDARSRLPVFRTSKLLATDLLRIVPRIKLTYPNRHDFLGQHHRELAPFLTEALQKRQHPELHLTLEPGCGLHTLEVDQCVVGQEQLDALLELTQITCLKVQGFSGLTSSRASADCSWRQLEAFFLDWVSAAYLPLHSLTHPLRLNTLAKGIEVKDIEELSVEVLAAAELNLCERNKAGLVLDGNLVHKDLVLSKATVDLLTEQYLNHRV
ncbi:hypothetical protein HaLaN_28204 [Haematococcus lacustris]|uniref:F-box domain-containing protein n=1 Tax=Haematococcus lacustris TaxID=44745 RepID=A0A6A0ACG6_HAELA|nr:hypothetical protein HaLaN_28204 [Haematococcus lacustris]